MKIVLTQADEEFFFECEAETTADAALLVDFGLRSRKVKGNRLYVNTTKTTIEATLFVAKHKNASNYLRCDLN